MINIVDFVSTVRHNQEEVTFLSGRQTIRNDIGFDSHKGHIFSAGNTLNSESEFFELGQGDHAIITVEVVTLSTGTAGCGGQTSVTL